MAASYLAAAVHNDLDQFLMSLETARAIWRSHRALVEAEDVIGNPALAEAVRAIIDSRLVPGCIPAA